MSVLVDSIRLLTHSEGLLETMFGGYALLVCVHGKGHHKLAEARVVGPVLWVRDQVLLAWWLWSIFPPLACKGLHKLGTNG